MPASLPEEIEESSSRWTVDEEEENHQIQQPHFQQEEWGFENNAVVEAKAGPLKTCAI